MDVHVTACNRDVNVHMNANVTEMLQRSLCWKELSEAQAFAEDPTKSWEDIEATYLGGQKLQGPSTCLDVPLTAISIVFSIVFSSFFPYSFCLYTFVYQDLFGNIKTYKAIFFSVNSLI